jgi:hypothetical protein
VPVISGVGGSGTTTAQVVASGKVLPVADATGVTVDTTTYDDNIKGSGKLTTLVFPADQGALAIAITGDAFPRLILGADATSYGLLMGDGVIDPTGNHGLASFFSSTVGGFLVGAVSRLRLTQGASSPSGAVRLDQVSPTFSVTSGALSTQQFVSGAGADIQSAQDVETITPCTFNPGAATTATVSVALSPDGVTYSTLGVVTEPAGVAFDGTIHLIKVRVPAGWLLKLTANAQAVLGLTTYY